jgi:hypothetical protein
MNHRLRMHTDGISESWGCSCGKWNEVCIAPERNKNGGIVETPEGRQWRLSLIRSWREHAHQ